jgi:EpsI family protein
VTNRRDILIGAACLATAGVAYGLVPRRRVSLLGKRDLDKIIPRNFDGWTSRDATDEVAPTDPDSLASKLYGVTVGRMYRPAAGGAEIMLLMAHGDTQSDDLMVHRPEICYPAFGFALSDNHPVQLPLNPAVSIPARHMVATGAEERETVIYWTRLGEYLPQDRKQQQVDRLRTAMEGDVADGILVRFSVAGQDAGASAALISQFAPSLIQAILPGDRAVLIGTSRAAALAKANI